MNLRKREKILVTGATGFVGRALIGHLLKNTLFSVRASVRESAANFPGNVECVRVGDLTPDTSWHIALTDISHVVHTAARVHVIRDNAHDSLEKFRMVNTYGTLNLARQAAMQGVRRFVYISSIKVNGERTSCVSTRTAHNPKNSGESRKRFHESDFPDPQDGYAISKWEAEQGLLAISRETAMEVVIIRPPLVYGPHVKANFLNLLQAVSKGLPLPLGSIKNKRSMIYVENLVDAIVNCVESPFAAGHTFLVSDGESLSTPMLINKLAYLMSKPPVTLPCHTSILKLIGRLTGKSSTVARLIDSLEVDISHIQDVIGWRPPYTILEGLRATTDWYLTQSKMVHQ